MLTANGITFPILLLQALAWKEQNRADIAYPLLAKALTQSCKEGFIRLYINEGEPVRRLLVEYRASLAVDAPLISFIDLLIAGFPISDRVSPAVPISAQNQPCSVLSGK